LRVEFFESSGTALMALEWTGPGVDGIIPENVLRLPEDLSRVPLTNILLVNAVTGPDGRYSVLLPPGDWQVQPVGLEAPGFAEVEPVTVVGGTDPVTVDFTLLPRVLSGPPDLIAVDLQAPPEAAVGGSFELSWTTRNDGDSPATAPWTETLLLSAYPSGFRGRVVGTVHQLEDLPAGAGAERRLTVEVPSDLRGGVYAVVRVDSALQVNEEQWEANNTTASATPVELRIADLQVVAITVPEAITLGSAVTLEYQVENTGLVPAVGPWVDRVRFSTGPSGGTAIATTPAPIAGPLAPGEHYVNTVEVLLPYAPADQAGNRYFIVDTDFGGAVPEESDANNSGVSDPVPAALPPPADLVVTSVVAPAEIPAGLPIWVQWSVRNDGVADAIGPWSDGLQLAEAADSPDSFELTRVPFTARIAPGETVVRSNLVLVPPALAGSHFVRVRADIANQLREDDEVANNLGAAPEASLVTAPNLVIESLTVPPNAVAGEEIEVSWAVRNAGTAPVPSAWLDRMFFESPTSAILQIAAIRANVALLPPDGVYEGE
ncbi:MAG: hypothetical protein KDM81_15960, partial [Verrucomicrobiae bacterium]|nr:hypothetical protein [Verrucomicrobiae bacterium]